jgi:DNA-binding protein HU-beta
MNKAELIAKLADDAGVTKTQANAALDSFVEAVTKTLKGGGKVTLVGFGTFSVSKEQLAMAAILKQVLLSKSKQKSC